MRKRISRLCSVSQTAQLWLCTATWSCNGQETELYKTTKVMQMISIGLIYVAELHKWTRDNLPFYWSLGSCVTYVQSHRPYTKDCLKKNVPPWKFNNRKKSPYWKYQRNIYNLLYLYNSTKVAILFSNAESNLPFSQAKRMRRKRVRVRVRVR